MATDYEIIQEHLKEGPSPGLLGLGDTICLSGVLQPSVWMINKPEGINAYYSLVNRIYNKDIKRNYTFQHVTRILNTIILGNIEKIDVTQEDLLREAKQKLPTKTIKTFEVMRNISGIELSKGYRKIGPFTFQKWVNACRQFTDEDPSIFNLIKKENTAEYVVHFKINSVTSERALEVSNGIYVTLEYFFAFILGRKNCGHEVRILRQTKENNLFHLIKDEDGINTGRSHHNLVYRRIDLNDRFFRNKKIQTIFHLVLAKDLNPIENRLNKAMSWIGKGILSESSIESIICYCSALESILIRDSKTIISPSIVATLAEYCAFFLGKNQSKRKELFSKIKEIYSERSAGTHGGKLIADPMIEESALHISRAMVFRMLELYPNKISTESDVIAFVDKLKYS